MKIEFLESFDHYLTLPREQAYNEFMDSKNLGILRVMIMVFASIMSIAMIINIAVHQTFNFSHVFTLLYVFALVWLIVFYKKIFNLSNIRRSVIVLLLMQLLMFVVVDLTFPDDPDDTEEVSEKKDSKSAQKSEEQKKDDKEKPDDKKDEGTSLTIKTGGNDSYEEYIIFFAIMLMIFKLPRQQMLQLFAIGFSVPLLLGFFTNDTVSWAKTLPNTIFGLILFAIAFSNERSRQKKFFEHYDFQYRKNFESIRMKRELNYARDIQLSMLPKGEAVINGVGIAGVSLPASEVGGDYFDYFRISDHETGVFICDVSGHGVASGLMLSALRGSMHLILDDTSNPKIVVEKLNKMIRKTQSRKMFVTAVLAIIDTNENKCRLYNAGHLPPYRISGETGEIFRIKKHGIALGAMGTVDKTDSDNLVTFDFKKNDKIILYTDGVNEAMNNARDEYGLDNLELFLNANSTRSAKELLDGIVADVKKFCGASVQRDDLSLLIIERL
ncbi:MAG: serine/threonine-protein phosphatase [Ignavibacteria bacterium]|nr:serine/threonine-protein phosphatase [Ignavibacteria bacterium]